MFRDLPHREDGLVGVTVLMLLALSMFVGCGQNVPTKQNADSNIETAQTPSTGETQSPKSVETQTKTTPGLNRDEEISLAEQLEQQGDIRGAESKLRALMLIDPQDNEIIFRLAHLAASRNDLSAAIELLESISVDHPDAGLPALGQSADWCLLADRYDDAERKYRIILDRIPDAAEAHRKLAYLYNRQGRRHEAANHLRELCRLGNVRQDELHALIQLSDAMFDAPPAKVPEASVVVDTPLYFPIGASGLARKLFMDERFREAVEVLHDSIAADQQPPSIVAFYGRAAAEAQDDARFNWWLSKTNEETKAFAEYWAAIGTDLLAHRDHEHAVRALLESLDRDPSDFRSIARLQSALIALGRNDEAERWSERWKTLRDISAQNNRIADASQPDTAAMEKLAELLTTLDRNLESVLWRSLAAYYQRASKEKMQSLQTELRQWVTTDQGFPGETERVCAMDLQSFPLPPMQHSGSSLPDDHDNSSTDNWPADDRSTPARFENVASAIGLHHAYRVATTDQDRGFSVYQSVGGAVAVIDFDLDGNADLYFAQGDADSPEFIGQNSNVLYRNVDQQLVDVTSVAQTIENRYSTGVTVGDWNQDGFPDIVVANIGRNSMWMNAGDGTFRQVEFDDRDDKTLLTTSLAMGDLNGDAIPDLFELNYLHDPELSKRPVKNDKGEVVGSLMPADFNPGIDRLILNDSRGQASYRPISQSETAANSGLGLILGDFDPSPGNEVFVGNDTDPNQLWIRGSGQDQWVDVAMARGCAFGFDGVPTASMGVAAGDFDRNGSLDFHVTNFQDEYASLFLNEQGLYQDRNVRFDLSTVSDSVLGFGTQAIDYDNNGRLDLVVTNGHIEQAISIRAPFRQPAQLFANLGNRFQLVNVDDPSGYMDRPHVGRGLARLDFNHDGKMDFVVTHLGETSALLVNQTVTENHWLQVELVGTSSERDAIGAKVDVVVDGRKLSEWVVSGDGFFCRNEAVVAFGLGQQNRVSELTVHWPGGSEQRFSNVPADRRMLIIEGDESLQNR
ncbi:MAG: VCBS repeat-containing protein [Planctomycetales bacterium]|nr:VCBS repeat-containing protein [Planctomycetales bacterium]